MDICGIREVAEILRVTDKRIHQLIHENNNFPDPKWKLQCGPIWIKEDIISYIEEKEDLDEKLHENCRKYNINFNRNSRQWRFRAIRKAHDTLPDDDLCDLLIMNDWVDYYMHMISPITVRECVRNLVKNK